MLEEHTIWIGYNFTFHFFMLFDLSILVSSQFMILILDFLCNFVQFFFFQSRASGYGPGSLKSYRKYLNIHLNLISHNATHEQIRHCQEICIIFFKKIRFCSDISRKKARKEL